MAVNARSRMPGRRPVRRGRARRLSTPALPEPPAPPTPLFQPPGRGRSVQCTTHRWDDGGTRPPARRTAGVTSATRSTPPASPIADPGVGIDLLGPVRIRGAGGPVTLTRRQEIAVLGLLALHAGTAVRTTALIDLLWPDDPPRTATKTLQGYVKRVRQPLGESGIALTHSTRPATSCSCRRPRSTACTSKPWWPPHGPSGTTTSGCAGWTRPGPLAGRAVRRMRPRRTPSLPGVAGTTAQRRPPGTGRGRCPAGHHRGLARGVALPGHPGADQMNGSGCTRRGPVPVREPGGCPDHRRAGPARTRGAGGRDTGRNCWSSSTASPCTTTSRAATPG